MSLTASIQPVNSFPFPSTQLRIFDVRVSLADPNIPFPRPGFAVCIYNLLSEDGIVNYEGKNQITTEQYNDWVGTDWYLITCVASNLGLTLL
jgi:hypothetical protein